MAAGNVNALNYVTSFTGDAGGTSNHKSLFISASTTGGNAISSSTAYRAEVTHGGSATLTDLRAFIGRVLISSSGNVTTATHYDTNTVSFTSTGIATEINGFRAVNIGNASATSVLGFNCADLTAGVTLTAAFRSQITSGTGKWAFYGSGTAASAFAGNVRIGSVTAPTVALDVTGAALISSTLGVTGVSSFAAGAVGAPGIYLAADTTSGLYRIGANNIGVAISGAKVLDIASTGMGVTGALSSTTLGVTGLATLSQDRGIRFDNQTSAAAAQVGTITNAPTAGDPGYWLKINVDGTNYSVPCWAG